MKLRGTHIYFRSNWSGDYAWFRRTMKPNSHFYCEQTPFWLGHEGVSKRFNINLLSKKWIDRGRKMGKKTGYGNSAHRLYWRTHSDEWSKIYESIKK